MTKAEIATDEANTAEWGRLTREEDSELRRLNFLAGVGQLSERSQDRFIELRLRDRRQEIRNPREFESPILHAAQQRWIERLLRMRR